MSKSTFYILKRGKLLGPFTQSQLIQLAKQGKISAESNVRIGSAGQWHTAGKIRGLQAHLSGSDSSNKPPIGVAKVVPVAPAAKAASEETSPPLAKTVEWFVAGKQGRQFGPFSSSKLRELAADRKIQPTDLVWRDGLEKWHPASQVSGLFVIAPPPELVKSPEAAGSKVELIQPVQPTDTGSTRSVPQDVLEYFQSLVSQLPNEIRLDDQDDILIDGDPRNNSSRITRPDRLVAVFRSFGFEVHQFDTAFVASVALKKRKIDKFRQAIEESLPIQLRVRLKGPLGHNPRLSSNYFSDLFIRICVEHKMGMTSNTTPLRIRGSCSHSEFYDISKRGLWIFLYGCLTSFACLPFGCCFMTAAASETPDSDIQSVSLKAEAQLLSTYLIAICNEEMEKIGILS